MRVRVRSCVIACECVGVRARMMCLLRLRPGVLGMLWGVLGCAALCVVPCVVPWVRGHCFFTASLVDPHCFFVVSLVCPVSLLVLLALLHRC